MATVDTQTPQQPPDMSRQTTQQSLKRSLTGTAAMKLATDPFQGSVNHLSEQQEKSFFDFKNILAEKQFYIPPTEEARASHTDGELLRFLRARKFNTNGALDQFTKTETWRKENQIEALYDNIDVNDYQQAWALYPQWIGRRDKRGIPVYVYQVAGITSKKMSDYSKASGKIKVPGLDNRQASTSPKLLRLFALYENLTKFVMPLCSNLPRIAEDTPIVSSNNIVDITGVGLRQMWNLKTHMQDASTLATAHYPETLDRIFIIGAPSFFPTLWGWIKNWFDPGTTSKIFILTGKDMKKVLETYINTEDIPTKYGGSLQWDFGQPPNVDQAVHDVFGQNAALGREWVKGPLRWMEADKTVLAVGSLDGKERRDVVAGSKTEQHGEVHQNGTPIQNGALVQNGRPQNGHA